MACVDVEKKSEIGLFENGEDGVGEGNDYHAERDYCNRDKEEGTRNTCQRRRRFAGRAQFDGEGFHVFSSVGYRKAALCFFEAGVG